MITFADNPKTEVIPKLSFEDYIRLPAINQTLLKTYGSPDYTGGCPERYRYYTDHPDQIMVDRPVLREGRLFHQFLLEPKAFKESTVILDDAVRADLWEQSVLKAGPKSRAKYTTYRTYFDWLLTARMEEPDAIEPRGFSALSTVKAWRREQFQAGLEVVPHEQLTRFEEMRDAIRNKSDVWDHLAGGRRQDCELTVLVPQETKHGGTLQLKARLDFCALASGDLIDLKTARSSNPIEFANQCASLGYDIQAAYYFDLANRAGLDRKRFGFLATQKQAPYLPVIHWMPAAWLQRGRQLYKTILGQIARSIATNDWPGYPSDVLAWPSWMDSEMEAYGS